MAVLRRECVDFERLESLFPGIDYKLPWYLMRSEGFDGFLKVR